MPDYIIALMMGCALDLAIGDPEWFPHPVRFIGRYISWCERRLRARGGDLRRGAVWLTASTVLATMLATALALWLLALAGRWPLLIGMAAVNWLGLSARCLAREGRGVKRALAQGGVAAGRRQVSRIVGRDTNSLSEREIICATVETIAENTTDGVISPLIYSALGGPVLMMGFKAVSTLDSMVGYMDEKYRDIGWSSARLDDIMGYVPARLCALMMCLAAGLARLDMRRAFAMVRRDHANHKSPNCAWSEAAAAGALGIQLGGTHMYFGKPVEKPTIGDALRAPEPDDIERANRLMYIASGLTVLLIAIAALIA